MRNSLRFFTLLLALALPFAHAEDWPQWRGANRDAVLHETGLRKELPEGSIPRLWTQPIGAGYSGPTVADGRVYVTDHGIGDETSEVERVLCFDAKTGDALWQHVYPTLYTVSYTAGPRASVTVDQGQAFAVGAMGQFCCLDAKTGDRIWQRDLAKDFEAEVPVWGITAAPLIYDDTVIQIAAGKGAACVVALDRHSGEERWRALDERAGYSAPILIQQGNQDVLVCWTGESVSGLDPNTGEVFWGIPMLPKNMPIGVPTPVVQDNKLFVSSFYDGSLLIEFDRDKPSAKKRWHRVGRDEKNTDALHCMISNPILKGDYIYGVDSYGELRCLKMSNGDRVWEDLTAVNRNRWGTIHIIRHGDSEIMLNEQGELIFATLSPDGFHEHSRAQLLSPTRIQLSRRDGVCWSAPAIADGHIFVRNDEQLVCASLLE
ncbi:outer membrane protein assembly factor BamB family protein [Novipirellula artificiosorum]|uniref:Outer membrane biogenesis protein BamB n=1 Tax=Novipirellula artificiosorum TaxID=2528016 RepID=A0A5C6DVX9_9BACT|nr:PQQ-binding-like beta-propeller repeat protein [Novipirellula artificiosorum]TWU40742.1 outer membrane biogenesis protein BamB [Novipirellula artificiosorum]